MISVLKDPTETSSPMEDLIEPLRPRLRAFLYSLIADYSAADDLTQETCLVLWEKRDEYDPQKNFQSWAFQIAFYQAQNFRRKTARRQSRELPSESLMEKMANTAAEAFSGAQDDDSRKQALLICLDKLTDSHKTLILSRYQDGISLESLSDSEGLKRNAIAQKLFRIRRTLLKCIQKQPSAKNA